MCSSWLPTRATASSYSEPMVRSKSRAPDRIDDDGTRWLLTFVEQFLARDHVLANGVEIERQPESRSFGNLDAALGDEVLLDQIVPPAELVGMILDGQRVRDRRTHVGTRHRSDRRGDVLHRHRD